MSTREIVSGDTLSKIANELGVDLDELLVANPQFAGNPDLIFPGQQVIIPGTTSEESDGTPDDPNTPNILDNIAPTPDGSPVRVGTTIIPSGARLVGVKNPAGSDENFDYFLVYDVFGSQLAYRVGGQSRMDELFPAGGVASFDEYRAVTQAQFDESPAIVVGEVDELPATESLQSEFERNLRSAGLESLPSWMLNDPAAIGLWVTGAREGWSEGRTWKALQNTPGFLSRFPGLAAYMGRNQLADVRSAVVAYVNEEQSLTSVLRSKRGANTNTSSGYLATLISTGWTPQEAEQVLEGENRLRNNPEALGQFQQLMALQGQTVGVEDFLDVFRGQAAPEVTEILNDTFRFQALSEQGLDINATFAQFLGNAGGSSLTPNGFTDQAQAAAQTILRFGMELDAQQFGLNREDVISAAFDQTSPGGRAPGEVNELIARFGRDRAQRAQGLAGFQAFINQQNRLQVAGLG